MKKIYFALSFLLSLSTLLIAQTDPSKQKILSMIVSFHNNAFGVDHLFDAPIEEKKLAAWLKVGEAVKQYVLENCEDIFGTQDTLLINSLNIIEKANNALVNALRITYGVRGSTKSLIRMAALFKSIEGKMSTIVYKLQNTTFILNRKKNAQNLLIALALFIEATAKKANKDTRMGHRTDILIPTTPSTIPERKLIPIVSQQNIPLSKSIYTEEPTVAPPTRLAPPIPIQ